MQVIYIQGSSTHEYLQSQNLLEDDQQYQPPASLFSDLQLSSYDSSGVEQPSLRCIDDPPDKQLRSFHLQKSQLAQILLNQLPNTKQLITWQIVVAVLLLLSYLFSLLFTVFVVVLLARVVLRVCCKTYGDGQSHAELLIDKLQQIRKHLVWMSVNTTHKQTMTHSHSIWTICSTIYQFSPCKTPIQSMAALQKFIRHLQQQHISTCTHKEQPWVSKAVAIVGSMMLQYRCGAVLSDLALYLGMRHQTQEIRRKTQQFEQREQRELCTKLWVDELLGLLRDGLRMQETGHTAVGNAKVQVAINLIQLQQLQLQLQSHHQQSDGEPEEREVKEKEGEVEDLESRQSMEYLSMETDGHTSQLPKQHILMQIQQLKHKLEYILNLPVEATKSPDEKEEKQEQFNGKQRERKRNQRRVQGVGGLFGLINHSTTRKMEQFYLE